MEERFDIVIIGTGIGASEFLRSLECTKRSNIAVLEVGGARGSKDLSYINSGREFGLRSTTAYRTGGTSNLWHGVLSPLDPIDFKRGDKSLWPIAYSEYFDWAKKAAKKLGVSQPETYEYSRFLNDYSAELRKLNIGFNVVKPKCFYQPLPAHKYSSDIKRLIKKGLIKYFPNSCALELIIEDSKVAGVKFGSSNGEIKEIYANVVVVGTGALETPRLLLNSGVENEFLGKGLMDHPMANLCQIEFREKSRAYLYSAMKINSNLVIKSGLVFSEEVQKEFDLPNHCFYLRPSFSKGIDNKSEKVKLSLLAIKDLKISLKDIWFLITNINLALQVLLYKTSYKATFKYADLFFVSEQRPYNESFVGLSEELDKWGYRRALVNWKVSKADSESIVKAYEILKEQVFTEDKFIFTHELNDLNWEENYTSAAHHVGTCRMAKNADEGVVDSNLKVFGIDNLYICDGSVFPTAGNVNNGLTIAALAMRLANHIDNL